MADVLSELLDTLEVERSVWGTGEFTAPWGFSIPGSPVLRFYLVVEGEARIRTYKVDPHERHLAPGDSALILSGVSFDLTDAKGSVSVDDVPLIEISQEGGLMSFRFGRGGARTLLVRAAFHVNERRSQALQQRLRPVVHIKSDYPLARAWTAPLLDVAGLRQAVSGPGGAFIGCRLAELTIGHVARAYLAKASETCEPYERSLPDPHVTAALQLMYTQPGRDWSLASLARQVGMSRSRFAEAFTTHVGESPMRFLMQVRMEKAAHAMKVRAMSVAQAAHHVGFSSETAFARAFRRHFGVAPTEFRRRTE